MLALFSVGYARRKFSLEHNSMLGWTGKKAPLSYILASKTGPSSASSWVKSRIAVCYENGLLCQFQSGMKTSAKALLCLKTFICKVGTALVLSSETFHECQQMETFSLQRYSGQSLRVEDEIFEARWRQSVTDNTELPGERCCAVWWLVAFISHDTTPLPVPLQICKFGGNQQVGVEPQWRELDFRFGLKRNAACMTVETRSQETRC